MKKRPAFNERLNQLISGKSSFLCVGLDPDMEKIPAHLKYENNPIDLFLREIVSVTRDHVIAYKANLAFFECEGKNGLEALHNLTSIIPSDVILILDGKRADIENTSKKYAHAYFDQLGAHAVTVNPYLGYDAVKPFLDYTDRGTFVLALTSNRGAEDFQFLQIGTEPLFQYVAKRVQKWNTKNNCGLVVSAKEIEELKILRRILPDMPFLIPGVGAQGGSLKDVMKYGRDRSGTGMLVNIGRSIIYAGSGKDFATKVKARVKSYVDEMAGMMHTSWDYIK
jgi:orotidine-5'-phosphate decarboxylase